MLDGPHPISTWKLQSTLYSMISQHQAVYHLSLNSKFGNFYLTSSINCDSLANWEEDEELCILDPVKEPLLKPEVK